MAATGSSPASERTSAVAIFKSFHHIRGSCSAQPGSRDRIGASVLGWKAEAMHWPVSALTRLALTAELPIS